MLKIREKFLNWLIDMATNHRRIVYLSTLIITLILGGAAGTLKMDMRWTELLPESWPVVKQYQNIDENYLQPGNMIVAITGADPVPVPPPRPQVMNTMSAPANFCLISCSVSRAASSPI